MQQEEPIFYIQQAAIIGFSVVAFLIYIDILES